MRPWLICALVASAVAGEAAPQPTPADPTAAVVAEGAWIYRQRDLDAMLLVAMRHARTREFAAEGRLPAYGPADEDRVRQVLIRAFTAREALLTVLADLPEQIPAAAREALVLDLLAYRAEPVGPAGGPPPASQGVTLVRLPPFVITRAVEGLGRRQLTVGLALAFNDATQAKAMEAQAPVIQDAVLGALRALPGPAFSEPDHMAVKRLLSEALRARIPGFPVEGLLIPQLEAGPADVAPER